MGVIELGEYVADANETALIVSQINWVAALEVDLDEHQTLIVLAEYGLEKAVPAEDFLEHQVVRRRQIMQIVFRGRGLRRPRDLVPHPIWSILSVGDYIGLGEIGVHVGRGLEVGDGD